MKSLGKKFPKTIFFIADVIPSEEEMAAAEAIGPGVVFRNAVFVPENPNPGQIEECDAVAGTVPPAYAEKYPLAGARTEVAVLAPATVPADAFTTIKPTVVDAPPPPPAPPSTDPITEAAPAALYGLSDQDKPAVNDGWGAPPPPPAA